jgi:hypothetical protein
MSAIIFGKAIAKRSFSSHASTSTSSSQQAVANYTKQSIFIRNNLHYFKF